MTAKTDLSTLCLSLAGATSAQITALSACVTAVIAAEVNPDADLLSVYNNTLLNLPALTQTSAAAGMGTPMLTDLSEAIAYGLGDTAGDGPYWRALSIALGDLSNAIRDVNTNTGYSNASWHAAYTALTALLISLTGYLECVELPAAPVDADYVAKLINNLNVTIGAYKRQSTLVRN